MKEIATEKPRSALLRERIGHPIIDADGHWMEPGPLFFAYLREVGGKSVESRFLNYLSERHDAWYRATPAEARSMRIRRPGWWMEPANTLDRATAMLPGLLRKRLDEFGFDVSIMYPTLGLGLPQLADEELRLAAVRAMNTMTADLFGPYRDRLLPVAVVPTMTPHEAISEARHAVEVLGFRAVVIGSILRRPSKSRASGSTGPRGAGYYIDALGLDSDHDYDPFWQTCVDLKVAVTAHSGGLGWPDRQSPTNFVFSHMGHFAAGNDAFCKSLILGGVMRRFPSLNVAFLEGGAAWSTKLYNDLVDHWKRRNPAALARNLSPALTDVAQLRALIQEYGHPKLRSIAEEVASHSSAIQPHKSLQELFRQDDSLPDDFAASGITRPGDLAGIFDRLFFGCEADDASVAWAYHASAGTHLRPVLGSDIGHWDVIDMSGVLEEAHELIEDGHVTPSQFREFTYLNAALLHTRMNPEFFAGTAIADQVRADVVAGCRGKV